MRGIRQWVAGAAVLAGASAAVAQGPGLLPPPVAEPAVAAALPGGTVVGTPRAPLAGVTVLTPASAPAVGSLPAAGAPIVTPSPVAVGVPAGVVVPPPMPGGPGCPVPGVANDCCGPLGAHGPVGQEVYFRFGGNFPIGDRLLVRSLNHGYTLQLGGRSQLFERVGDTAWAADLHVQYQYNNAQAEDVLTVRDEPVLVRSLHRWAVGFGLGQDMFLDGPGFVGGTFNPNFRLGWDAGVRLGTGHVDLNPLFDLNGYRRKQDTFWQPYVGVMASTEVPIGGWTWLGGARLEWDLTMWNIVKESSFHEVQALLMVGVRY